MRKLAISAAMVAAITLGVAVASAIVPTSGNDTVGGPDDVQPASSAVVSSPTQARDGGDPWAVRVYTSKTGLTCPDLGRVRDGVFGRDDVDGTFTALPLEASGSCADLGRDHAAVAARRLPAMGKQPAETIVFGVTVADASVTAQVGDAAATAIQLNGQTFVLDRFGDRDATVDVTTRGGTTTFDLSEQSSALPEAGG